MDRQGQRRVCDAERMHLGDRRDLPVRSLGGLNGERSRQRRIHDLDLPALRTIGEPEHVDAVAQDPSRSRRDLQRKEAGGVGQDEASVPRRVGAHASPKVEDARGQRAAGKRGDLSNRLDTNVPRRGCHRDEVLQSGDPKLDAADVSVDVAAGVGDGADSHFPANLLLLGGQALVVDARVQRFPTGPDPHNLPAGAIHIGSAQHALDFHVAKARPSSGDIGETDRSRAAGVLTLQTQDLRRHDGGLRAADGDGTHHVDALSWVRLEMGKGQVNACGARSVFDKHQVQGGVRHRHPAFQMDRHSLFGRVWRQSRDLFDFVQRVHGLAAGARAQSERHHDQPQERRVHIRTGSYVLYRPYGGTS